MFLGWMVKFWMLGKKIISSAAALHKLKQTYRFEWEQRLTCRCINRHDTEAKSPGWVSMTPLWWPLRVITVECWQNSVTKRHLPLSQHKEALENLIQMLCWELREILSSFLEEEFVLQVTGKDLLGVLCSRSPPSGDAAWGHLCIHSNTRVRMCISWSVLLENGGSETKTEWN